MKHKYRITDEWGDYEREIEAYDARDAAHAWSEETHSDRDYETQATAWITEEDGTRYGLGIWVEMKPYHYISHVRIPAPAPKPETEPSR